VEPPEREGLEKEVRGKRRGKCVTVYCIGEAPLQIRPFQTDISGGTGFLIAEHFTVIIFTSSVLFF